MFFVGLAIYYWWRSQQIKEKAYQKVLTECYRADVELLDGSIALIKQGPAKDLSGRLRWFRTYQFEFTSTREYRYQGWVKMAGFYVVDFYMPPFHVS